MLIPVKNPELYRQLLENYVRRTGKKPDAIARTEAFFQCQDAHRAQQHRSKAPGGSDE